MTLKEYGKQLAYLNEVFRGKPPKWMLEKLVDVYERTKNNDLNKLGESVFNDNPIQSIL